MIFSRDYFVKGEVEGAFIIEAKNYKGEVEDTRSFIGENSGKYILTLSWEGGRESKTFNTFATALSMANGYWSRQSIWHEDEAGKRKRVVRWQ